jgi:hypothetical protein
MQFVTIYCLHRATQHIVQIQSITTGVQVLPVLRKLYPEHWIFSEHPIFQNFEDGDVPQAWEVWELLQWDTFTSVERFIEKFKNLQFHKSPEYVAELSLQQRAATAGATWATAYQPSAMVANPARQLALLGSQMQARQVLPFSVYSKKMKWDSCM